jgi:putative transposase
VIDRRGEKRDRREMARLLRVEYEGAIYHVTIRGNERRDIFADDADRLRFVERLGEKVKDYGIRLYLFVLMKNHVHLVLETPGGNLSRFMHSLQTAYSVYYNLRHNRSGHFWQGRFGAKVAEGDEYLLKLSRYVHLNPVFVGRLKGMSMRERIEYLRGYSWSSYPSYIGKGRRVDFVEYGPMLSLMRVKKSQEGKEYRKYVESGLAETDKEWKDAMEESRLSVGGEEFRRWVWDKHMDLLKGRRKKEDVLLRKERGHVGAEEVLKVVAAEHGVAEERMSHRQRGGWVRPVAARMLCRYSGLTQREVAEMLKLKTGAAVSAQMRRLDAEQSGNRELRRQLDRIEEVLSSRGAAN